MPPRSQKGLRRIVLGAMVVLGPVSLGAQQSTPIDAELLIEMLERGVTSARVITIISDRCISFRPSPPIDARVREAGGSNELVQALRRVCNTARRPEPRDRAGDRGAYTRPESEAEEASSFGSGWSLGGGWAFVSPTSSSSSSRLRTSAWGGELGVRNRWLGLLARVSFLEPQDSSQTTGAVEPPEWAVLGTAALTVYLLPPLFIGGGASVLVTEPEALSASGLDNGFVSPMVTAGLEIPTTETGEGGLILEGSYYWEGLPNFQPIRDSAFLMDGFQLGIWLRIYLEADR